MYNAICQNQTFEIPVDPALLNEVQLYNMCYRTSKADAIADKALMLRRLSIHGWQDNPLDFAQLKEFEGHAAEVMLSQYYLREAAIVFPYKLITRWAGNTLDLAQRVGDYYDRIGWWHKGIHPGCFELAAIGWGEFREKRIRGTPYSHFNFAKESELV